MSVRIPRMSQMWCAGMRNEKRLFATVTRAVGALIVSVIGFWARKMSSIGGVPAYQPSSAKSWETPHINDQPVRAWLDRIPILRFHRYHCARNYPPLQLQQDRTHHLLRKIE